MARDRFKSRGEMPCIGQRIASQSKRVSEKDLHLIAID